MCVVWSVDFGGCDLLQREGVYNCYGDFVDD
jgi:hypothetical protein